MQALHTRTIQFEKQANPTLASVRWVVTALFIALLFSTAQAQVKSSKASTNAVQDSIPTPGAMGWSAFTQAERQSLELSDEQLMKLKAMDDRLEPKYQSMGIEPWMSDQFPELNRQRNQAVQDILSPEQYQRWARPSTPVPSTPPTIVPEIVPESDFPAHP